MGIETFRESDEIISAKKIHIPSPEEIATLSPEELHCDIWRKNNDIFLTALEKRRPPYFGLHGTSGWNLKGIQATKTACVNIGIFFDKNVDPEFLLTVLYDMCRLTQCYAFHQPSVSMRNDQGGVMIIDIEAEGRNRSYAWEPLCRSLYDALKLAFYTENDLKIIYANHPSHAHRKKQNSQRSEAILNPVSFEQQVKGIYPWEEGKLFEQKFPGFNGFWRTVIQKNLSNQNMLKFCLEKVGVMKA